MSPIVLNKTFTAYDRKTTRKDDGGFDFRDYPAKKKFRGRMQSADPRNRVIAFGAMQVPCSHELYATEDLSGLDRQDIVVDDATLTPYEVQYVKDESGLGRIWHVFLWRN